MVKDTSTLQTGGRTDNLQWQYRVLHYVHRAAKRHECAHDNPQNSPVMAATAAGKR